MGEHAREREVEREREREREGGKEEKEEIARKKNKRVNAKGLIRNN